MLEKMFTTKMSMDKEKLKNRFLKIRSKNSNTAKIISGILFGIVIALIIAFSLIVAVNNITDDAKINALYQLKDTSYENKENIEKMVNTSDFVPYKYHSLEIWDNEYENRVVVKFMVEDRSMHRELDNTALKKLAAIVLSLVPEAEAVSTAVFDKYSEDLGNLETSFYSTYTSRYDFHTSEEFSKFTADYIKNSTLTLENFKEYYDSVSKVTSAYELSDYLKQTYAFIGKDYETVINSGIGAEFLVDKEFLASNECKEISSMFSVDLSKYEGYPLHLRKTTIRNFKTNMFKKHIMLFYNEKDKTTMIKQKIIDGGTKIEDGKEAEKVKMLIIRLMEKTDGLVIPNAENMTYTQVKALQYQVNNGHFVWRLSYEQVIQSFVSSMGEDVENGKITAFAGDSEKCSATYQINDNIYKLELYKPIDKSEYGIWIVRSCEKIEPAVIKEISFYNVNPKDNTLNGEIKKQEDGWYKFPSVVSSFLNFNGTVPEAVTAYFAPTGTNMEQYAKQIGFANPPFPQIPLSILLTFAPEDTLGHLWFVFDYEDGTTVTSQIYNVYLDTM